MTSCVWWGKLCAALPVFVVGVVVVAVTLMPARRVDGQIQYTKGQNVAPAFEGWEQNPDGSFNLLFGYFNRNFEERLHIPIGPNNTIDPGGPDQGQPTYFLPRRNRHIFRIRVPKDFGDKEVVWTLTSHGKTEKVYGTLKPDYILDDRVIYRNNTGLDVVAETENNKRPTVRVEGSTRRTVNVGEPLRLTAVADDDGIPKPAPMPPRALGFRVALGLRVAWFVYRGPGETVSFDPEQFKVYPDYLGGSPWTPGWAPPPVPADRTFPVVVTFHTPGTFVVRVQAHDGGADATQDVTVIVNPAVGKVGLFRRGRPSPCA